jgi:hypothetical protein
LDWGERLQLTDLEKIKQVLPSSIPDYLESLEQTREQVLKIIGHYKPHKPDPVTFLADCVKETWMSVEQLRPGEQKKLTGGGKKPNEALCDFTVKALSLCGISRSEDHVSDVLRGRSNRRRSGQRKATD